MRFPTVILAMILLVPTTAKTMAQPDISQYIQNLRDWIAATPVPDPSFKTGLSERLDDIEDSLPPAGYARQTATSELVDAFHQQLMVYLTESETSPTSKSRAPMENGPDPFAQARENVARMGAELFFDIPELDPLEFEIRPGPDNCEVIILSRGVGHQAFDPGGTLYVKWGDRVELEARGGELGPGAEFSWEIDYLAPSIIEGARAFILMYEPQTADVTVTFKSAVGTFCQDKLRVVLQDMYVDD
jgi:hypothetical protein